MALYYNVDRIYADLDAAGIGRDDPVTVMDLIKFDQYHYEGIDAINAASSALQAAPGKSILDIGSGLGGPARYMASTTGCNVTALELQPDLHETGITLTNRCDMSKSVRHLCGDILANVVSNETFDGIMSVLCFLHIPNRTALFIACANALRSGGRIFIEDYFGLKPLTDQERAVLADKVCCPYLPDLQKYKSDLIEAGFKNIRVEEKTADWSRFVTERYGKFKSDKERLAVRYDTVTVDALDEFYACVVALFEGGRLGGVRMTAEKGT